MSLSDIHEYGLDEANRTIYLTPEDYTRSYDDEEPGVEYLMASKFIKNLHYLQNVGDDAIDIHMKTNGGHWMEGLAIYQAIKMSRCYITIFNHTHARSMSSIILQGADHRVMMPYSHFMYHDGTISMDGTLKQFWTEADQLKLSEKQMMDIYLDRCCGAPGWKGRSRKEIAQRMRMEMDRKEEVYLTAKQAVDFGFADEVMRL